MSRAASFLSMTLILLVGFSATAQDKPAEKKSAGKQAAQRQKKQQQHPPKIDGAKVEVYKTVNDIKLNAWIFQPTADSKTAKPAVVFFFGGGWRAGSPTQFVPHCEHLAAKGIVGIVVDYRVSSRHQVKMTACVSDAKSAIRWVRKNADRLGIDPDRIAAGGGSAGGHLAAATALLPGFDESTENQSISSQPNAMVLFNPALVLAPVEGQPIDDAKLERFKQRVGVDPAKVSPYHHISENVPPAIIFHGKADATVPYATAEVFAKKMNDKGNRCELVGYEGQGHGFFNVRKSGSEYFRKTVAEMDKFLASIGYLPTTEPEKSTGG